MSDAPKAPLDTAAAETVLAQLAVKAEKQAEKAKKATKKAKKIGKGIEQVLKTYDLDESIVEIAPKLAEDFNNGVENLGLDSKTPLHAILTIADMASLRDKFNAKAAKKTAKQADYDRAAQMVRKAFKIEAPKAPLPPGPREIIFAIDMAGQNTRQVMPVVRAAHAVCAQQVVAGGRKAVPYMAHVSNQAWLSFNTAGLVPPVDAEYTKSVREMLTTPFFKEAGFDLMANYVAEPAMNKKSIAAARHFVMITPNDATNTDKLAAALAQNPQATVDVILTKGGKPESLAALRAAFPRRVAVHSAATAQALTTTLSLVTNARLDQRVDALNAKPKKAPAP